MTKPWTKPASEVRYFSFLGFALAGVFLCYVLGPVLPLVLVHPIHAAAPVVCL